MSTAPPHTTCIHHICRSTTSHHHSFRRATCRLPASSNFITLAPPPLPMQSSAVRRPPLLPRRSAALLAVALPLALRRRRCRLLIRPLLLPGRHSLSLRRRARLANRAERGRRAHDRGEHGELRRQSTGASFYVLFVLSGPPPHIISPFWVASRLPVWPFEKRKRERQPAFS